MQYSGDNHKKVDILGVGFDYFTMKQATDRVVRLLESDERDNKVITTANPEIVMAALKDESFFKMVNQSHIVTADGIGIIYGSRVLKRKLPERVGGFDLMQNTFARIKDKPINVFFLGAGPGVAKQAQEAMILKHPGLSIVGVRDGYFKETDVPDIIREINDLKVDLLMVGLGAPKQELFMFDNKKSLKVKVMVGVGGSLDGMSGVVKRAPDIFIKLNLEWFYRLIKQPSRWKRMLQLPLFMVETIKVRLKGNK